MNYPSGNGIGIGLVSMDQDIATEIRQLKRQQKAVILAHNYQRAEIQDIADYVGDSLDLAKTATKTNAEVIIFCGVDFMGESAKILNPEKTVIIPDRNAQCPMAAMADPVALKALKKKNPAAAVVSYINTSAQIKALSDICCTSANGVAVIQSLENKEILFVPDANLGAYIKRFVTDKKIEIWPGFCPTHDEIQPNDILTIKNQHPSAEILVHPECRPEVIDIADQVFSTNGMVRYAANSKVNEFIIGTEIGLCYRLETEFPNKSFYPIPKAICPNMKKITLNKVLKSLKTLEPQLILPDNLLKKAKKPLQRMMDVGRGDHN